MAIDFSREVPSRRILPLVMGAVCTVAVGTAFYFFHEYREIRIPQELAEKETTDILKAVGMLMVLPEGEEPTLATVSSPDQLKDQPFFAKAKKGDKVLIYTAARRAILYDPVINKIIDIAPLSAQE